MGGGWRRIASLNMTNPNVKCPTQFRLYSQGGVVLVVGQSLV